MSETFMCELFFRWHFEYLLTTKRSVRAGVLSQIYLDFSGVFVVLIVVLERLAVDLLLAVGQVHGQEVLRVAVADLQEFPAKCRIHALSFVMATL